MGSAASVQNPGGTDGGGGGGGGDNSAEFAGYREAFHKVRLSQLSVGVLQTVVCVLYYGQRTRCVVVRVGQSLLCNCLLRCGSGGNVHDRAVVGLARTSMTLFGTNIYSQQQRG